ncbi:hypothetical protein A3743_15320, partial [Oleiphilus sp. HI0072]
TYDVIHEGKAYPPKLVVSWANVFASGDELDRNSFNGGKDTACFRLLEREGFQIEEKDKESYWFVGASFNSGTEDQTDQFCSDGVWVNGYTDKHLDDVKRIKVGEKIAIKSTYTKKNNLPFEANGNTASVMGIKAVGVVTENKGDGRNLKVDWHRLPEKKEWFFYTHRGTIWELKRGKTLNDALIDFTFNNKPQDYDLFRNDPYWKERFGEAANRQMNINLSKLQEYQIEFLKYFPGCEGFQTSSYLSQERDYKVELKSIFDRTCKAGLEHLPEDRNDLVVLAESLMSLFTEKLDGMENKPQNLVGWRYTDFIRSLRDDQTVEFVRIVAGLLYGSSSLTVRVNAFQATLSDLVESTGDKANAAQIRSITSFFLALFDTEKYGFIKTKELKRAIDDLAGRKVLGQENELVDTFEFFSQVKQALENTGWKPKDLIDVQSFLYVCQAYSNDENSRQIPIDKGSEGDSKMDINESSVEPLNQILYGPPGTGKTYNTIDRALEILDLPFVEKVKTEADNSGHARALLKKRFDELKAQGRIHFVTFHQSFSYEDFVEGIKASTLETGISYSVESGIFKKACTACKQTGSTLDLDSALNQFIEEIAEQSMTLKTPTGKEFTAFYKGGNTTITCIPKASEEKRELPASIDHIKQVLKGVRPDNIYCESYVNGIVSHVMSKLPATSSSFYVGQAFNKYRVTKVSDHIVEITKPNGKVLPYPMSVLNELKGFVESGQISVKDIGNKGWQELDSDIEPYLVNGYDNLVPQLVEYLIDGGKAEPLSSEEDLPVVLIIDEINRGNISSIFGELITLIEPSKRAGAEEALSVTLPYSKETFQVPSNLYLIGTMNTADRSLALMDTALRRRFDFVEMMPDVDLLDGVEVNGINIKAMLTLMNKRIEVLFDREHTLGHAFFMPLTSEVDEEQRFKLLQSIFSNKILPLLEEYFFEDWAKIRLVLGDDNKASEHQFISENGKDYDTETLFGKNVDLGYELEEQKSYTRNDEALVHPETYLGIYA